MSEQGQVVCHAGGTPHAGRGIASGQRWILVLFVIAKNQPEFARRCHAMSQAVNDHDDDGDASNNSSNNSSFSKEALIKAGLSQAPRDHLLWTSLGGVAMSKKDETMARGCLAQAALSYPHCTAAHMALGRMFLAIKRPRAALRRFDAVLDWMQDRDVVLDGESGADKLLSWPPLNAVGFDARVLGAQAALICARQAMRKEGSNSSFDWKAHTRRAKSRCSIALQMSPGDPRIQGMLEFCDTLLMAEKDK